jgi:hypothetical protein
VPGAFGAINAQIAIGANQPAKCHAYRRSISCTAS